MFHNIMGGVNLFFMFVLGGLFYYLTKMKKRTKEKHNDINTIKETIATQEECISSMVLVTENQAILLRLLSDLYATGELALRNSDKEELSKVFKEASYRIQEHINGEDSDYRYSFLNGECFNDTNNCILVLSEVLKHAGTTPVQDIIKDFKFYKRG